MSDKPLKQLVYSMIKFLRDEVQSNSLTEDSKESLEVAIQCLESAYNIKEENRNDIDSSPHLLDLFCSATGKNMPQVTEEMKTKAEKLKSEGNNFMKMEKYSEAITQYNEAINLDPCNAVYFCNRAAAHSKMENHNAAIEDCTQAIRIDPMYSKAYGRMGLAYANLNNHGEARNCYQKAVDIDPTNESYANNLKIAEEKVKESNPSGPQMPGGLNFSNFLNNPALMNMASSLMSDPGMQNLMSSIMNNEAVSGGGSGGGGGGIDGLLQVGQQLASQMQSSNPELVEQLRQQMQNNSAPSQQPPKPDDQNKQT